MTTKKSDKWDEGERINTYILELIDLVFESSVQLTKEEILDDICLIKAHAINRYASIKEIEFSTEDNKAFNKFHDSLVRSQYSMPDRKQMDFFWFTLKEYGLEITREQIRKISDEEINLIVSKLIGEISDEEFIKQHTQMQNPTIDSKKTLVDFNIQEHLAHMEKTKDDNLPIRPEVVARISKTLEGYDDAPDIYKMIRILVYQAAGGENWDEAEIEMILEKEVEEMLKDRRINKKEYSKIKKIIKRETDKKIQRNG